MKWTAFPSRKPHNVLASSWLKSMVPHDHTLKPLKPWAKISLYAFRLIARCVATATEGLLPCPLSSGVSSLMAVLSCIEEYKSHPESKSWKHQTENGGCAGLPPEEEENTPSMWRKQHWLSRLRSKCCLLQRENSLPGCQTDSCLASTHPDL